MKHKTIKTAALTGCVSQAVMQKSDDIAKLPSIPVKVDGSFGGFGTEGTFDIAGIYKGKFTRDVSSTDWFGIYGSSEGGLAAEITKIDSNLTWRLACHGDQGGFTLGGFNMADSDPFECDILVENQKVGSYSMKPERKLIGEADEKGFITLEGTRLQLAAVKKAEGSSFSAGQPLGYSFTLEGKEVAATETNAHISIQMTDELTPAQKDAVVVGSVASALSWRPEYENE